MNKQTFDSIRIGQRMCSVTRPGTFPTAELAERVGEVIEKHETRWGYNLVIECEDGSTEHGATSAKNPNTDKGIGWYRIE